MINFCCWNVEWMNYLFTSDQSTDSVIFHPNDKVPYRGPKGATILERRTDLAGVIDELNLDVIVVTEGPNRSEELQLFFDTDVAGSWKCIVQSSGSQSIGMAVRLDTGKFNNNSITQLDTKDDSSHPLTPATNPFLEDTDGDGLKEQHKFERKPLYVELKTSNGKVFRVVGVHLKSKGIFDALEWTAWWAKADGNRKKILAQCNRLREEFLIPYLDDDTTTDIPLILCGDINDGPGMDTSEMKLQSSGIERLMGVVWKPRYILSNALFESLPSKEQAKMNFSEIYTASFRDPMFGNYRKSWIDHILYTKKHGGWVKDAFIHHKMTDDIPIYKKYPGASDHRPVSCTIDLE